MRELFRSMAKAEMARRGYSKINKCLRHNHWREIVRAWPTDLRTDRPMKRNFHGKKRYRKGPRNPAFTY